MIATSESEAVRWRRRVAVLAVVAIALRLVLFTGRGDYVAFDEGWYLLLGRSLMTGQGYSLIGIPHVTLSPLFPLLSGIAGVVIGDWIWGGRVVAAIASGLLVLPVWAIAARLGPPRTAFGAAALVAGLPSLAPFVAPYWVGADLWVGAEPLWHLLLYTAFACWLRAASEVSPAIGSVAGVLLGLGFLARPEAVIAVTALTVVAVVDAFRSRTPRRGAMVVALLLGFFVTATPYWVHLRIVTGEWRVSGRGIRVSELVAGVAGRTTSADQSTALIEAAVSGDETAYIRMLYAPHPSGRRMGSDYWGVYPPSPAPGSVEGLTVGPAAIPIPRTDESTPSRINTKSERYRMALAQVVPSILWPLLLIGLLYHPPSTTRRNDLAILGVVVATSVLIARFVAVDARTQLLVAPLAMIYVSGGSAQLGRWGGRLRGLRSSVVSTSLVGACLVGMAYVHASRLSLSLTVGSPHHIVGAQNRWVAMHLRDLGGDSDGPVASGHPAIALFADRDWRPLPLTSMQGVIKYATAAGATTAVFSSYYHPFKGQEFVGARYLILPLPARDLSPVAWSLTVTRRDSLVATGQIRASP